MSNPQIDREKSDVADFVSSKVIDMTGDRKPRSSGGIEGRFKDVIAPRVHG